MKVKDFNEFGEKAGAAVRENIAHIIFGVAVVFIAVISFTAISGGSGEFNWFGFAVNVILQISVFIPYRWRQKRLSGLMQPYVSNRELYGKMVEDMQTNNRLTLFSEFCNIKAEELKRVKQLELIHRSGIDTKVFDDACFAGLSKKQLKTIERANTIKLKPINPTSVTANCSNNLKGYGIEFNDATEDMRSIASKLVSMLAWAIVLTYIVISAVGTGGFAAVVLLVFRIFMCLMSMFSGIMSGDGFIIRKDRVILARINFINLFNEWVKTQKEEPTTAIEPIPVQ